MRGAWGWARSRAPAGHGELRQAGITASETTHSVKMAIGCWIPLEDLRGFLNAMPGPELTPTDVAQRTREFSGEGFDEPNAVLKDGRLGILRRGESSGHRSSRDHRPAWGIHQGRRGGDDARAVGSAGAAGRGKARGPRAELPGRGRLPVDPGERLGRRLLPREQAGLKAGAERGAIARAFSHIGPGRSRSTADRPLQQPD